MTRRDIGKYGILGVLLLAIGGMTALVSYSVTLYRLFCQVTGSGGTTQRVADDDSQHSAATVTVHFNTNTAPNLPWLFRPLQRQVKVHLGDDTPVFFEAENMSDHAIVGHATFNVTPDQVGIYFKKIQCFCFTEERLGAHEKVPMPVQFFVDPRMATDPETKDVHDITLSYTFFESKQPDGALNLDRFTNAPPDPAMGAKFFASQCSGCHELNRAKDGPPLANVVGRTAGTVPGYPYSQALAKSGIVWNDATLDKWLTNPELYVRGATMPMTVANPTMRHDIIAYLKGVPAQDSAAEAVKPPPT